MRKIFSIGGFNYLVFEFLIFINYLDVGNNEIYRFFGIDY